MHFLPVNCCCCFFFFFFVITSCSFIPLVRDVYALSDWYTISVCVFVFIEDDNFELIMIFIKRLPRYLHMNPPSDLFLFPFVFIERELLALSLSLLLCHSCFFFYVIFQFDAIVVGILMSNQENFTYIISFFHEAKNIPYDFAYLIFQF